MVTVRIVIRMGEAGKILVKRVSLMKNRGSGGRPASVSRRAIISQERGSVWRRVEIGRAHV